MLPAVGEGDPGRAAAAAPEERLPGAGTRPSLPPLPLQGIPSRRARRVPPRQRLRHRCRRWQRRCRIDAPPSFSVGTDRVDLPSAGSTGSASPTPPTSSPTTSPASPSPCQGRPRRLTATGAPACGRQEGLRSHYAGKNYSCVWPAGSGEVQGGRGGSCAGAGSWAVAISRTDSRKKIESFCW